MAFSSRSFQRGTSTRLHSTAPSSSSLSSRKVALQKLPAPSVYGGAGGSGTRISTNYGEGFRGHFQLGACGSDALLTGNEKLTMQNLNDRLAAYLERVRSLEETNSQIEKQITEWYVKNSVDVRHDYSSYFKTIEDLQNKVSAAQLENARLVLQIDNAKLAADDFRLKYENELLLRQSVESDINGLLQVLDGLTLTKVDLELQIESVKEELALLTKNHEEEADRLRKHAGGTVNVAVDAAPSTDLATLMEKMRLEYEEMAEKYRQEAKDQFETQTKQLNQEVETNVEQLQVQRKEATERRQILQGLEVELQSHLSMKKSLEDTLAETEARYGYQLARVQEAAASLEAELRQLRADTEAQNNDYRVLLDAKTRLEAEIATYHRLLEGEDSGHLQVDVSTAEKEKVPPPESSKIKKIKTIVEEMVDGKVVSSEVKEIEEKL